MLNPFLPPPDQPVVRTNYFRRGIGILVCLGPVPLVVASLAAGVWAEDFGIGGLGLVVGGFLFGVVNAHLSWVRPWRYRRRHGSLDGYRFVSGIPGIGTFCVVAGNVIGFGEVPAAALGLMTLLLDTGGLSWFLIATWHDRGFWDERTPPAHGDPAPVRPPRPPVSS